MSTSKISLVIKSFERQIAENASNFVMQYTRQMGVKASLVRLPTKVKRFSLLKAPFKYHKHFEAFQVRPALRHSGLRPRRTTTDVRMCAAVLLLGRWLLPLPPAAGCYCVVVLRAVHDVQAADYDQAHAARAGGAHRADQGPAAAGCQSAGHGQPAAGRALALSSQGAPDSGGHTAADRRLKDPAAAVRSVRLLGRVGAAAQSCDACPLSAATQRGE